MGLPPQERKESYTWDEVQHMVSRQVMAHRMDDAERRIGDHETSTAKAFSDIKATLQLIRDQLNTSKEEVHISIENCRREFRAEVERDFATQAELAVVEGKVDRLTAKIVGATAVIVFVIQLAFQVFGK